MIQDPTMDTNWRDYNSEEHHLKLEKLRLSTQSRVLKNSLVRWITCRKETGKGIPGKKERQEQRIWDRME